MRSKLVSMHRQLLFAIVASQFTAVLLAFAAASLQRADSSSVT